MPDNRSGRVKGRASCEELEAAITEALDREEAKYLATLTRQTQHGKCHEEGCHFDAFLGGYCQKHYARKRTRKASRRPKDPCAKGGEEVGERGRWGLCLNHYREKKYKVIKDALIAAMGGTCAICDVAFRRTSFDFHHVGDKDGAPSRLIGDSSVKAIAYEISKCVLLCANCHRLEHTNGI